MGLNSGDEPTLGYCDFTHVDYYGGRTLTRYMKIPGAKNTYLACDPTEHQLKNSCDGCGRQHAPRKNPNCSFTMGVKTPFTRQNMVYGNDRIPKPFRILRIYEPDAATSRVYVVIAILG